MYPKAIQDLIKLFSSFPTVGSRTASRFVFHVLKAKDEEIEELISAIQETRKSITLCSQCFNSYDTTEHAELCSICRDTKRNGVQLCIVEKESDLEAIENINEYKGLYFLLGGTLGPLRKENIDGLRIEPLKAYLSSHSFEEVILAMNSTTEGEATMLYLERILKPLGIRLTRLARGLPVGGELEYADDETLSSAFEGRK